MTGLLVAVGVPVAAFTALVVGVWHHRGRHTGRHVARPDVFWPDVYDATRPIAHTEHGPPWDDAPEPDPGWVADLRAALDEVQPSGWVKPELHHILAAPTLGNAELGRTIWRTPQAEPSRLADTADHHGIALALDVADYMAAQDADATRYGGDLADWCARQLRELRETLCLRR